MISIKIQNQMMKLNLNRMKNVTMFQRVKIILWFKKKKEPFRLSVQNLFIRIMRESNFLIPNNQKMTNKSIFYLNIKASNKLYKIRNNFI